MSNVDGKREVATVRKMHRLTHATSDEMKMIFVDASRSSPKIRQACEKVFQACYICASSGRPRQSKKISISHVNEAFNEEFKADFMVVYIKEKKYFVLNMMDTGTRYGERMIAESRNTTHLMEMMENEWLYHHGAPKRFGADPEFCKPFFSEVS